MAIFNNFININPTYINTGISPFRMPCWSSLSIPIFNCFNNINIFPNFTNFNFFGSTQIPFFSSPFQTTTFNIPPSLFNLQSIFQTDIWSQSNNSNPWSNFSNSKSNWSQNFYTPNINWGDTFTKTPKTQKTTSKTESSTNIPGYSPKIGEKLADIALNNSKYIIDRNTKTVTSKTKEQSRFTGLCATYVKAAIRDAGLGDYEAGHAYQMADILRKNKNFKEISPSSYNYKELPAGCVLVYNKGSQDYSEDYGHTEIVTRSKKGVSDGITNNIRKPDAIFVPVIA